MDVLMRVVDIETNAKELPGEILELGLTDVTLDTETLDCKITPPRAQLFKPYKEIPAVTRAVHHIGPKDVADAPPILPSTVRAMLYDGDPFCLVAHKASFEQTFLGPYLNPDQHWICTFKAAKRQWPHYESHSNQALRYERDFDDLPDEWAMPPHRAGPDTYVTAHILMSLLQVQRVSRLVSWTMMPEFFPVCPIGKHKGQPWADLPYDYLQWMVRAQEMEPDLKAAARDEMDRRAFANRRPA